MPYRRSKAKEAAHARMKALQSSFVYAKIRTRKLPTFIRDTIFQNCVFQLSATLEDYLGELAGQWLSFLVTKGTTNSAIPIQTRALFVAKSQEEAFKRYWGLGDEQDLATRIIQQAGIFAVFNDDSNIPELDFDMRLVKDRKFPSVRNVETMFRRLGKSKMLQQISKRTKSNVELSLQAFMDVRNARLHTKILQALPILTYSVILLK